MSSILYLPDFTPALSSSVISSNSRLYCSSKRAASTNSSVIIKDYVLLGLTSSGGRLFVLSGVLSTEPPLLGKWFSHCACHRLPDLQAGSHLVWLYDIPELCSQRLFALRPPET